MKTLKMLVAALAAVGLAFVGMTVSAATINLTMNSWGDLATAVKNAAAGDTISVTPGTADTTYQATSTIKISKSLTIVSADNANRVKISNSSNKVLAFEISGSGTEVRFEKIDFSGSGVSTAANPARGMIYSSADKLRLSYCTFNGCTVGINDVTGSESAGAVTASGDLLRMNDCTFRYCRAVNHCAGSLGRQSAAPQCAGAVASIAKNTIVRRCSFVDNEAEGFENCGGSDKWVPGAIMAGCYAVPTDATPPVLTIMNSTFADNSGSSAVFALNNGLRIIGSTFVGNDGRALRFKLLQGFKDQYCQTGSPNGNLYIVNSVFLGNWSGGQYCDFTCSDVETYAYYSVFSSKTNFGSPGIDCKFLSDTESNVWRKWFLNDAAPCVTAVLGADHYAYPLSPRAYEGGNNVAKVLYYDETLDVSPSVYGYGGNPKSPVWSSFADHTTGDRPVADQGVDLRSCRYGDTHYPSCGSARSIPTSVRFKVTDRPEDDEVVSYMWNYEDVEFPENFGEKEGHSFKTWTCNGKSYAPGDTMSVNVLSEQCYGGNGIPGQEIEVGSVWEGMWCTLNFQTAEGQAPSHDPIYNNHIRKQYGEAVTIRCPKDSVYDGYWVSGWATSAERAAAGTIDFADGEEVASLSLFGSVDLYWVNRKPNKATYSFKKTTPGGSAEGIGGTEFSKVVETDDASVVPTCPFYRPGYRFDHWYSGDCEENLVEYYPGWGYGKVAANGSTVELYPHWTHVGDFSINCHANNGTDAAQVMLVQSSSTSDIRLPSAGDFSFSYDGHTFVGWSKTATDQYDLFPAGVSAWDIAEQDKAIVDLYAVWADAEGSSRTCPTTDPSIQLQIRLIDVDHLTCALERVICAGDMPANWTIPDTANDGTKNWMIVMYDGTVADDLWAVTEVTIGQHVAAGAECLQEDVATYTRSKILVPAANATYASIEGLLVSKDKKHLLAVPCGWDNAEHVLEIPEGIETVEAGACNTLKKIKTVIIPSTVNTDGALKTGSFGTDAYGQNWGVNPLTGGGGISQFYFRGNFKPSYMETPDVFHATGWAVQTCPPIIRDDLGFVVGYIPHPSKNPNNPAHKCAVVVPEGVTSILGGAFEGCVQMTSLTLPSTLETIGDWGFEGCTNLTEVALPEAVKYIGDEAFAGCSNLVEVTGEPYLGDSSVGIDVVAGTKLAANADAAGEGVMFGSVLVYQGANGSQETVDVPGTVTGVAGGAFRNASGVVNVNLPLSVAWIGEEAFADNDDLVRIRLYVGTVVDSYFADKTSNANLTELEIYGDDAADALDGGVWYGDNSYLDTLVIGAGIKTIPDGIYQWTTSGDMDIAEVVGGQDLVSVGRTAFEGTSFADPYYKNRAIGGFYVGYFPEGASDKNAVMGDFSPWDSAASGQLRRVSPDAFKTLTNLQTLKFGRYVEAGQLTGGMFCDLTSLTAYIVDAAAVNYATDGQGILYNKDMTKIIAVPKALAGTITIPESVTEIGDHAFEDCKATTIKGGKNVVNIGVDAFKNCPANPFLNLSRLQLFDLNGELVQNIPATTLEAVQLPHPTNFAAVVASLPYPMWPRSGKWICTADGNAYSTFTPAALDSVYEFTPEVVDASGTYSLRYDKNAADATGEMALVADLVTGDLCELERNKFVREGYAFTGWNTRPDGTGDAFADEAFAVFDWPEVFGGDTVTLYAQWTAKVAYTLAFDADATYATDVPEPMACFVGDAVPLPSDKPVREGWKLTGWRNADSTKDWTVDDDFNEVVAAGTTYTLYATWAAQETSGCSYTDAKGTAWHYTRTGDAIEIVGVVPGPTVFSLEVPSAIKGGAVNQESARKVLPVRANGVWWWYEVLSGNATCLLTSHAGALPDAVSLPGEITGWPGQLTVVGVGEDALSTDENVTKVTILTDGEWKEIWGEKNGSGKVAKIHVPGAAPSNWQGSLRYLFVNAETCCYDPEETSWTAYKSAHAGDGLVFAEEGTYEIRFNKNAVDATGEMPNKVCVIGRKYPPLEGSERINYTRGDWTFVDWFCDPACTEKAELGGEFWNLSTTPGAIVDVYAKWVKYAPKAVVENGGKTLRFVFDDANHGVKGDDWFDVSENEAIEYNSSICNFPAWGKNPAYVYTNVVIDASFGAYRPKGCQGWFVGCFDVVAFEGLANLNTSSVTNMAYMFSNCGKIGSLDLSGFDTSKVVDMNLMFSRCANLTRIDATGRFTTEALQTPSSYMFYGCAKLEGGAGTKYAPEKTDASYAHVDGGEGDPGYFSGTYVPRTAKAVLADGGATLRFVFDRRDYGVQGTDWFAVADAETIDPESESVPWSACYGTVTKVVFDESFVSYRPTQCGRWFSGFTALEAIEGLANLDTSSAASFAWMFSGCASLTSLDLSAFDTANVTDMTGMFSGCSSLVTISVTESFTTASVVTSDGMFAGCTALKGGNGRAFDAGAPTDKTYARIDKAGTPGYFTEAVFPTTAKAVLENGGKTLRFVFDNAYYGAKGVKWFAVADAEAIDPEEADVPWYGGCAETVTNVVFDSSFAGYKPTRCGSWFYGFEQLETIEGLANFDTSNVTDMRYMFSGCASLTSLDLSNFDTSNVTNMHDMFGVCASLTSLDLSAFDTANVTNMSWMFWGCASLTSLDLSAFDTANVTEMIGMLGECTALEEVDLSSFDTANVTEMSGMFYNCTALEEVDLSSFDTANVTEMSSMFYNCTALEEVDLSSFDTANVTEMSSMFYNCPALTTIYVSESFVAGGVSPATFQGFVMFSGCESLVGGNGTEYSSDHVDADYARIDGKGGLPGYFTEAAEPPPGPTPTKVKVTFDAAGGTASETSRQVTEGAAIGTLPTATRTGYDFAGWFTAGGDPVTAGTAVMADMTIIAHWTPIVYTISYNLDGGVNAAANPTNYTIESAEIALAAPTREGYAFAGWTPAGVIPVGSTGDRTFTAGWDEILPGMFEVTFDTAGGTVDETTRQVTEGAAIGDLPTPTRTGYDFDGWFTAEGDPVAAETAVTADMTIIAHWTPIVYTISYNLDGGVNAAANPTNYTIESAEIALAAPTREGYAFAGWTPAGVIPVGSTGDRTFTAGWDEILPGMFEVTFDTAGGTVGEATRQVTEGAAIGDLPTPTRTGYDFDGWFTAEGDPVAAETAVTADMTIIAHWTPIVYTISYDLDGGVNAAANPTNYTIESAAITLAAPTREGYMFAGWTPAGVIPSGSTGDRTFTAGWDEILPGAFVVAFDANGGTVGETTRQVTEGAAVGALPTATRDGFDFLGWFTQPLGGDEVTAATAVTDDVVYYAQWVIQSGGPVSLDDPRVAFAPIPVQVYANELCEPAVTMTFNGQPCAEGGDFEVIYENNDFVGAATATVTGVGNFTGTRTLTFQILPLTAVVGRYLAYDLEKDLGVVIDADYKAGDKVAVKVEGLAKGLKVAQDKSSGNWMMTGVPTETVDCRTRTMYARVTVTCKDKTKGVKGKLETLWPLPLEIVSGDLKPLAVGALNQVYEPADIATLWPEVADAKANPKEWSFKGWPAGIKYNSGTKAASWSYKLGGVSVKTNVEPYKVYGIPTKAGEYTITATHKRKLADGKTTVSETYSAVLTVWGDDGATDFHYTDQAYGTAVDRAIANAKSVSGLPTGLKFKSGQVTGTPTKAGVFAVTLTKTDKSKETFLWKIAPATAPTFALDMGTAPITDLKAQIVQGANQAFEIAATAGAKVTVSGLPSGLKLVQDKATKLYSVKGVASKPGEYFVTFKAVLNGVTTVTTAAFTVKGNPFVATYRGYYYARPATNVAYRLAVAEVTVAAAGTVKLTYTEGKTKYTASVKRFDWNDATGKGTAEGLVLKVSSADKKLGYGDRKATVTLEDCGASLMARMVISDANGSSLVESDWGLHATVKTTEVPLPASQTFVFRTKDGADTNALATVSLAYDAKKATAAFSGKLYDGTAVKATVPVIRWSDGGTSDDYAFAPFLVIAKDGTVYCFDAFSSYEDGGYIYWVDEAGETIDWVRSPNADYSHADKRFAELVPAAGTFTFGWGSDAAPVGATEEKFAFVQTLDKKGKPAGVEIYDSDPQEGEKPLAKVTAKVGKRTGAISVSFTSKKGDKAKYAVELVWRGEELFAGHVMRTWKDGKVSNTAYGTADVK